MGSVHSAPTLQNMQGASLPSISQPGSLVSTPFPTEDEHSSQPISQQGLHYLHSSYRVGKKSNILYVLPGDTLVQWFALLGVIFVSARLLSRFSRFLLLPRSLYMKNIWQLYSIFLNLFSFSLFCSLCTAEKNCQGYSIPIPPKTQMR